MWHWTNRQADGWMGMDAEGTWLFFLCVCGFWLSASMAETARSLCGDVVGIFSLFLENSALNVFRSCQQ